MLHRTAMSDFHFIIYYAFVDLPLILHLYTKYTAMTNKEILNANLLDIVFENRNKEYGAYALRKGYHNHMLIALGTGLSVILLLIFITGFGKNESSSITKPDDREGIIIKSYELLKVPDPPKEKEVVKQKPVIKTAAVKFISNIKIAKEVTTPPMAAVSDMEGKNIAEKDLEGKKADGTVQIPSEPETKTGNGNLVSKEPKTEDFIVQERNPEFPGGAGALKMFLSSYLSTPENLDPGEKKVVKIRFRVDKDGSVNTFEIVTSGGKEFDNEVVRVCKKMPRWVPAIQNGINVPVNYVLPVTFIGAEE